MVTILTLIIDQYPIWPLFLIFARILGAMMICPLFSKNYLSAFLRAALALVFACMFYPAYAHLETGNGYLSHAMLLFSNLAYGALIGYLLSLPIWLIESCGRITDTQRGEQMGAVINQITGTPSSSIGKLVVQAFIAYLVINNGLLFFIDTVGGSFIIVPINNLLPVLDAMHINKYIEIFSSYLYWVAALTLPLIVVMLFIDLILGLISSFIPQLNVTIISMPIKSVVALFILTLYLGSLFHNVFTQFLTQIRQLF